MYTTLSIGIVTGLFLAFAAAATAQDAPDGRNTEGRDTTNDPQAFLQSLVGSWSGTVRTWFKPDELSDESAVKGEFKFIPGGQFLRHTYAGSMKGKPRTGEETIAFNAPGNKFQTSWWDDFHMNYGIIFSEGGRTKTGFSVTGKYDVGPGQAQWGWRTLFELTDDDHLTITAFNVMPDGGEAKGVETRYTRNKP